MRSVPFPSCDRFPTRSAPPTHRPCRRRYTTRRKRKGGCSSLLPAGGRATRPTGGLPSTDWVQNMPLESLRMRQIDTREQDIQEALCELRERLSPRGDVVSEASRQRTLDVFGAPLSPIEVVRRICQEVQQEGLPAVLRYSQQLDGARLDAQQLRVPGADLETAHREADREFLQTVRRIRDNIGEFQTAIRHQDVTLKRPEGVTLTQRYVPLQRIGICVPGGAAAYPSTVLMTAVPRRQPVSTRSPWSRHPPNTAPTTATCWRPAMSWASTKSTAWAVSKPSRLWRTAEPGSRRSTRSWAPGTCLWRWPRNTSTAKSTSIPSPAQARSWSWPIEPLAADFVAADLLAQAEHAPGASLLVAWEEGRPRVRRGGAEPAGGRLVSQRMDRPESGAVRRPDSHAPTRRRPAR